LLIMNALRAIFGIMLFLLAGSALAHSSRTASGDPEGLTFPSIGHGELLVLSDFRGEIHGLARSASQTDPTFRRLLNYSSIAYSYCLWGIAPRAAQDEESPFNECTHAYLSADKALLFHMRSMPGIGTAASELISKIDVEMIRRDVLFIGCIYTGEPFSTAEFITPHWENFFLHPPTWLVPVIGIAGMAVASLVSIALRRSRTKTQPA
jgi:hypothetical protein